MKAPYGTNAPFERKADDAHDNAAPEIKKAVAEVANAFTEFQKANDLRLKEIEKRGSADTLTEKNVKALEDKLQKAQDDLATKSTEQTKRMDQLEAALRRSGSDDGKSGADLEKKAASFSATTGRQVSVDGMKAYNAALDSYVRKGREQLSADEMKALSVGSQPDGGYMVNPDTSGRLVELIFESSPMRQICNVVTIGTDALEGNYDLDEATTGWVGETESRSETGTPQIGEWRIPVHEQYAEPRATQKLLDDAVMNMEDWLAGKVADKLIRTENTAFVSGNGVKKPRGFLDYVPVSTKATKASFNTLQYVPTTAAADFATTNPGDALISLMFVLKNQYRQKANWLLNRTTLSSIRKFKDGQGNYLWQPNFEAKQGGLLLGSPIVEAEDMPGVAAGAFPVAFGDFNQGYQIVDRQGIRILRDAFTAKPYVKFYTTKRVGGDVINFEAIKLLKCAVS